MILPPPPPTAASGVPKKRVLTGGELVPGHDGSAGREKGGRGKGRERGGEGEGRVYRVGWERGGEGREREGRERGGRGEGERGRVGEEGYTSGERGCSVGKEALARVPALNGGLRPAELSSGRAPWHGGWW